MGRVWRCKMGWFEYIVDYIWDAYAGSGRWKGRKVYTDRKRITLEIYIYMDDEIVHPIRASVKVRSSWHCTSYPFLGCSVGNPANTFRLFLSAPHCSRQGA